jgi:hypothetical protein
MFQLSDITELQLYGVYERNVPGLERVVLRAWPYTSVPLGRFLVTVGMQHATGGATPLYDNFCWLGEYMLSPNQWLFLYTGRGHDTLYEAPDGINIRMQYWNRPSSVFTVSAYVPMLLRADGVACDRAPPYVLNPPAESGGYGALPRRAESD